MKIILAAAALAFAFPAAAQTAPAAGHEHHQQHQHGQAAQGGHAEHSDAKKHEKCDMSAEECRKRCAEMHGEHKAGGEHAGHKPNG